MGDEVPTMGQQGFLAMMELASHGPDTSVGTGPRYPWDGLYGGQVVAQALRAAGLTIAAGYLPHSLHAYFLRLGDAEEPVRFEVERLRNGRSFVARHVVARQSTGAILNMATSFQIGTEPTMEVQIARPPAVAGPERGTEVSWSPLFELRLVEGSYQGPPPGHPHRDGEQSACSWFRLLEDLGDDPVVHAAALAYASDSGPAWLAEALHEAQCRPGEPWRPLSLDHAIWFHRPFRADRWLLFQAGTSSLHSSRGLTQGRVFDQDGALVATVAQEVFLRRPRQSG
jgi:acyl-CoA thioesterase-2